MLSAPGRNVFEISAKPFDHRFNHERNQKQERDSGEQRKRKKACPNKPPHAGARFRFYSPNDVEGVLQLPENTRGAEQCQRDSDRAAQRGFFRCSDVLRDVLHHSDGALIEKIGHLLDHFVPDACRIFAKEKTEKR